MSDLEKLIAQAMENPDAVQEELARIRAEESLKSFIRQGWTNVIPRATPFVSNWHIDIICEHLEAVSRGDIRRLLINMPPRHMKSVGTNVFWPAWDWIINPHRQFLFTTFRTSLTVRDSVRCRQLIKSNWYQKRWGDRFTLSQDQNNKLNFANSEHGYRLSTSFQGGITGDGGDIVVIDDPHNAMDVHSPAILGDTITTYSESIVSRLNDPEKSAMILTMQRLHEKDLTGHIVANETGWTHICLPARYEPDHPYHFIDDPRTRRGEPLWEDRFNHEGLRNLEISMGSHVSAGQLQQRPAPRAGGMFQRDWFEIVTHVPQAPDRTVRGWDFAATEQKVGLDPDWTVGLQLAKVGPTIYITDMKRFQGTPQTVEARLRRAAESDGVACEQHIPQDPGQAGKSQVSYLTAQLAGFIVKHSTESGSKLTRAEAVAAQAEAGNIKIVQGHWNEHLLYELTVFPNGRFDDVVDALSRAFHGIIQAKGTVSARSFRF